MLAKHISHKLIDSLSDGVFAVALTLLGFGVSLLASTLDSPNRKWEVFY